MSELEDRWRDLGEFIREQRHLGQLSLRKLSDMAGISNPYLSQIERGLRKPSAEILQQIAKALHISAETLYVRAGILDAPVGGPDVVDVVQRDLWLTEEQKKTLLTVYESFRAANEAAVAAGELSLGPLAGTDGTDEPDEARIGAGRDDGPAAGDVIGEAVDGEAAPAGHDGADVIGGPSTDDTPPAVVDA